MQISVNVPAVRIPSGVGRTVASVVGVVGLVGLGAVMSGIPLTGDGGPANGVSLTNDGGHGASLTVTSLAAGQQVTKSVTIRNPHEIDSRVAFAEMGLPTDFAHGALQLTILQDGQQIYSGQFGAMADYSQDRGFIPALGATTFTFVVSMPSDATDTASTPGATLSYQWTTQP